MEPLTFRTARPEDVDAVVALVESAYRGEVSRTGWTTEAELLDGQRTDAEAVAAIVAGAPDRLLLLAERGAEPGRLEGTCQLERRPTGAYFGMFAVRPDGQGSGTGRALLTEAETRAVSLWGATTIRMTVLRQRGDLIAWYERLGYRLTGETEPFPYGNERFGRPTRTDLEFVVLAAGLPVLRPPGRTVG